MLKENNSIYITKLDFDQHPNSNSAGKSHVTAIWDKVLGSMSAQWVRLQTPVWGVLLIIPGQKLISSSVLEQIAALALS